MDGSSASRGRVCFPLAGLETLVSSCSWQLEAAHPCCFISCFNFQWETQHFKMPLFLASSVCGDRRLEIDGERGFVGAHCPQSKPEVMGQPDGVLAPPNLSMTQGSLSSVLFSTPSLRAFKCRCAWITSRFLSLARLSPRP